MLKQLCLELGELEVVLPVEALVAGVDASPFGVIMLRRLCTVHWPVAWNGVALSSEDIGLELQRCADRLSQASSFAVHFDDNAPESSAAL